MSDSKNPIMYGAMWCGDTRRARKWFDEKQVVYDWVDVDKVPEADQIVKQINNGNRSVPTIVFADGSHLTEPSVLKLEEHAKHLGLLAQGAGSQAS